MLEQLKSLAIRIDELKNSPNIKDDFHKYLIDLQALKNEPLDDFTDEQLRDPELIHQISSLINYKTYNELSVMSQMAIRFGARRGMGNYKSWNNDGQYFYDIYNIELRLNAIIFKLTNGLHST